MTKFYIPEDGDIVKILPILKKDGTFCPLIKAGFVHIDGRFIYDQSNYLKRIWHNERFVKKSNKTSNIGERFWFFVLINGEFKFMQTGKKLTDIIKECLYQDQTLGSLFTSDKHLRIVKTQILSFPCFDGSSIVENKWNSPNISTQTAVEWTMKNQPIFIEDYLQSNGIFANLKMLNEYYDNAFSDLIAEDRNKKLETIGI
jgi:hypothetical protein